MSHTTQHQQGVRGRPAKRYTAQGKHTAQLRRALAALDDTLDTTELMTTRRTR